jgi:hypothetical protein
MATGYWVSMSVYVAAKLALADLLVNGPKSADDLAQLTKTHSRSLYRLLRALSCHGVFHEHADGRFCNNELSECLRSDNPASQRAFVLMSGEEHYRAWGELEFSIRTGKTAFDEVFGKPVFDYLADHPEQAKIFDDAMVGVHGTEATAICDAYDFSGLKTLVDVGGGNGSLLRAILKRTPRLNGILFDLPHVVDRAKAAIVADGLGERCAVIGGDFFQAVPAGHDGYLMRHIIHDWDEEKCDIILGHIRKGIAKSGKLLLGEGVIGERNTPSFLPMLDLTMLTLPGGMERTESEYQELLRRNGFGLRRVLRTRTEVCVLESEPV